MVNSVLDGEIEIGDGGKLEHAAEVQDAGGLLGRKAGKVVEIFGEGVLVELEDVSRGDAAFGAGDVVEVERAGDDAVVEAVLGGGNVPGDFGGAAGLRVRAIVGVGGGDGGDDGAGGAVLVFDGRELVLEEKRGLLGIHGDHLGVTSMGVADKLLVVVDARAGKVGTRAEWGIQRSTVDSLQLTAKMIGPHGRGVELVGPEGIHPCFWERVRKVLGRQGIGVLRK